MPIMVSPFEYIPKEWNVSPKAWLDNYIYQHKLPIYKLTYDSIDLGDSEGYYATLFLGNRKFASASYYRSTSLAQVNVIILALLNIAGYCETAQDLQNQMTKALANRFNGSNASFATQDKRPLRKNKLARSLDTCYNTSDTSSELQKETRHNDIARKINVSATCKNVDDGLLKQNGTAKGSFSAVSLINTNDDNLFYTTRLSQSSPVVDRLNNLHNTGGIEHNLSLYEIEIDGVVFKACDKMIVVHVTDIGVLDRSWKYTKLGYNCYKMPIYMYSKSMGRACWVYYISGMAVYFHPCKILTLNNSGIYYELKYLSDEESLKNYCSFEETDKNTKNNHLVLLSPIEFV